MKKRTEGRIFGYWFDGDLYCPLCFSDLGKVSPDEIIFMDSIDAHFGKCHRCGWPLWGLYQYERYLDRRKVVETGFNISDDLSDLDAVILESEIELMNLWVNDADPSIFNKVSVDLTHYESTVSQEWLDKLLDITVQSKRSNFA